jgi:hypothetical protein
MSPNDRSPKPRTERLRTSCDSCHLSKVKCSKTRPLCSRCLVCGTDCTYSPSARVGRKSKKGNHTPSNSVTQTENTVSDHHNQSQTSSPSSCPTPFYSNDQYPSTEFNQGITYSSTTPSASDPHSISTSDSWIQSPGAMDLVQWGADAIYPSFLPSDPISSGGSVPWSSWYSPYMDQDPYINPGVVQYPCDTLEDNSHGNYQ